MSIISLLSNFSADAPQNPLCDSQGCTNKITMFCVQCDLFRCNTCNNEHTKKEPNHSNLPVVYKYNALKVLCSTHNTTCKYMCCDTHVCGYCIHRDHMKHHYINLDNEIQNIKRRLNVEIEKYKLCNQTISTTNEYIQIARNLFDESIKLRKQNCITSYIHYLNSEEKKLREEFNDTLSDYKKNLTTHNFNDLKELSTKSEIEFGLLKDNIMKSIEQLSFVGGKSFDVTLDDTKFMNSHPLGEIIVDKKEVANPGGLPSFIYHDSHMRSRLTQQRFYNNWERFINIVSLIEILFSHFVDMKKVISSICLFI